MDLLGLLSAGADTVQRNSRAVDLRRSAETFLAQYDRFAGFGVYAASAQAERVLGAAMMLRPQLVVAAHGDTVILDVNIASGTLLARAARRLRDAGNEGRLVAIVLQSLLPRDRDWVVPELSAVVISGQQDDCLDRRQQGESCNSRVLLAS